MSCQYVRDGIVYCLTHPTWPNLVKIGFTRRSVRERLRELNTEALPGRFEMACAFRMPNANYCEQLIHAHFAHARRTHEFFEINPATARAVLGLISSLVGGAETTEFDSAQMPRTQVKVDSAFEPVVAQEKIMCGTLPHKLVHVPPRESPAEQLFNSSSFDHTEVDDFGLSLANAPGQSSGRPRNRLWRKDEEETMCDLWRQSQDIYRIADILQRSVRAIAIRLLRVDEHTPFLTPKEREHLATKR